jgi:hypothetical protein
MLFLAGVSIFIHSFAPSYFFNYHIAMKPKSAQLYILFFTFALFLISSVHAQSPEQKRILDSLAREASVNYEINRLNALQFAKSHKIPVRFEMDAQVMELQFIQNGVPFYYTTLNRSGAQMLENDKVWEGGTSGLNLSGNGQTLGIWDGGATRLSHIELAKRVVQADASLNLNSHATHVAATMIGAGVDSMARGMAYKANLRAYDWNNDDSNMANAASKGLKVSQHSYGFITGWRWDGEDWYWWGDPSISIIEDYRFGYYDQKARIWDNIAFNAPNYLIVKSAGNDRGYGPASGTKHYVWNNGAWEWSTQTRSIDGGEDGFNTTSSGSNAKNVLTVGAVNSSGAMTSFSAWGPTDDGRIKPDIVAKGLGVFSATAESDSSYAVYSGTSMSGPMVSGSVGLILEHQQNLHGSNTPLKAATKKGLIVHTASELDDFPGPDYKNGWGLMNTRGVVELMSLDAASGSQYNIRELTLHNTDTLIFELVALSTEPLKATIAWTDRPGYVANPALNDNTPKLINDLDLRITDPSGTIYRPWVLDPNKPANRASQGDNYLDNTEQVFIKNPLEGRVYNLSISHKNTLTGSSQPFSLILSGIQPQKPRHTVTFFLVDQYNQPVPNGVILISGSQLLDSEPLKSSDNQQPNTESDKGVFIFGNEDGIAKFSFLRGDYTLSISKSGLQTFNSGFTIGDYDYQLNITLKPANEDVDVFALTMKTEPTLAGTAYGIGHYTKDTPVSVSVKSNEGYLFRNWTDNKGNIISLQDAFILSMPDSSASITANFDPIPLYAVTLSATPIQAASVLGSGSFYEGSGIWIEAFVNIGYDFKNWTDAEGHIVSQTPSFRYQVTDKDVSFTANFVPQSYNLNISILGEGSVWVNDDYFKGNLEFDHDTEISINAIPAEDWQFSLWTGNFISVDPQEKITMNRSRSITAVFEPIPSYTLSLVPSPSEGGIAMGAGTYKAGSETYISAIPNEGYLFAGWQKPDGIQVAAEPQWTFFMPPENTTLSAIFQSTVGLSKDNLNLQIFPNPAQSEFVIQSPENIKTISLLDISGKTLFMMENHDPQSPVSVAHLQKGIYFVRITTQGVTHIKKLLIGP